MDAMTTHMSATTKIATATGRQDIHGSTEARADLLEEADGITQLLDRFDFSLEGRPTAKYWLCTHGWY